MIEASAGSTVYAVAEGFASGLTGTIGIRVLNNATGATTTARTTSGISESPASSGRYVATLTAPSSDGAYSVLWDTGSVSPSTIVSEELNVGTTLASLGSQISGTVTVSSPVANTGDVTLVHGDDYSNTDSRALSWTTDDASEWPTLTGASVTFAGRVKDTSLSTSGTVVQATGANKSVRVELTAAQTGVLKVGRGLYDVQATLSSGRKVTLQRGVLIVQEDFAS